MGDFASVGDLLLLRRTFPTLSASLGSDSSSRFASRVDQRSLSSVSWQDMFSSAHSIFDSNDLPGSDRERQKFG